MQMPLPIAALAQSITAPPASFWIAIVVMLGAVLVGGVIVVLLRRRYRSADSGAPALGLTLADLRTMRDDGRLTEAEFERAKAMVIGGLGGRVERMAPERVRLEGRVVDGELRARPGYDLTGQKLPELNGDSGAKSTGLDTGE